MAIAEARDPYSAARLREGAGIPKTRTGIKGLDEVTSGGLPTHRPTLVCGSAGCGKTVFALEFLVRGAVEMDEPGVFIAFEESAEDLADNARSLGFDLQELIAQRKLVVDYVHIDRSEIEETGEYDLEGLFIRLADAIDSVGAKRVALDTLESLFGGLDNTAILRAELRRLFRWLKQRRVTVVVTGESGEKALTRNGMEEYVSDCVIVLTHKVLENVSTRRLRIVKYRGSTHGTNEYPFLIREGGLSVLPITSIDLDYPVSSERVSTGFAGVDSMLDGGGLYRGSSVLVSGTPGSGKTLLSCASAIAACARGERAVYFAFEESPEQLMRNQMSVGLDLRRWVDAGLLVIESARPTLLGLEGHLVRMNMAIDEFRPSFCVVDPVTNLIAAGQKAEVASMLVRLVDNLKSRGITSVFTSLLGNSTEAESGISSWMDTWIAIGRYRVGDEHRRGIHVVKSRGMAHSNRIRQFVIGGRGIELTEGEDAGFSSSEPV